MWSGNEQRQISRISQQINAMTTSSTHHHISAPSRHLRWACQESRSQYAIMSGSTRKMCEPPEPDERKIKFTIYGKSQQSLCLSRVQIKYIYMKLKFDKMKWRKKNCNFFAYCQFYEEKHKRARGSGWVLKLYIYIVDEWESTLNFWNWARSWYRGI